MQVIVTTGLNSGPAEYQNMGDVAMLQMAVARLLGLWPNAGIYVLTDSPSNLARYCPGALPLSRASCASWVADGSLLGRYHGLLPKWASTILSGLKRILGRSLPRVLELMISLRLSLKGGPGRLEEFKGFMGVFQDFDLLVACGSGGFADSCRDWNLLTLWTMEAAIRRRIPVVMFGQGMGPLSDPIVLAKAKRVLPKVSRITLRGTRGAETLLQSVGVSPRDVLTTGDEAMELAYLARVPELGDGVGINLRVASYAEVKSDLAAAVGPVVREFARQQGVRLLPLPIAFHEFARDQEAIRQLLAGFDNESDGGLSLDSPQKLIEQTGRCRIVVTGAYHAAVFALAQGIPVVCLCNSCYYSAKFQGLEDLFGVGCTTVMLGEPDMVDALKSAIDNTWKSAELVRASLLEAARRQIEASRGAYQGIRGLVADRKKQVADVISETGRV